MHRPAPGRGLIISRRATSDGLRPQATSVTLKPGCGSPSVGTRRSWDSGFFPQGQVIPVHDIAQCGQESLAGRCGEDAVDGTHAVGSDLRVDRLVPSALMVRAMLRGLRNDGDST